MQIKFRLSDEDRQKFGGDEWVTIDMDQLVDLPYDRLVELERDIRRDDTTIVKITAVEWPEMSALGIRGMIWLARQMSGVVKPAWPDFRPKTMAAEFRVVKSGGGDADPPTGGSSEPLSATKRSRKA